MYDHDLHRLYHAGLRGHASHMRSMRIERLLQRWGWLLPLGLLVLGLVASWPAQAEPGNAPDTKGHFVLVVGGSYRSSANGYTNPMPAQMPLLVIPGFTSFKLCVGAGKELQARLNTDGYTLDFSCLAVGK